LQVEKTKEAPRAKLVCMKTQAKANTGASNICLNGRHWLARQLDRAGVAYRKRENCLIWVEDLAKAQQLLDQQVQGNWQLELERLLWQCHPTARRIARPMGLNYYWSVSESEYASDVLFDSPEALARLYPSLVHHAVSSFGSTDVMHFLGRKVPTQTGRVMGNFKGEIISDMKYRPEGIRVKHSLSGNSVKLYDKQRRRALHQFENRPRLAVMSGIADGRSPFFVARHHPWSTWI